MAVGVCGLPMWMDCYVGSRVCELQRVVLLAARRAVGDCIGSCSGNVERVVDHVYWIWLWGYLMFDMF